MDRSTLFRKKPFHQILSDMEAGYAEGEGMYEGLRKELRVKDLTAMGIAAVVGAGIFSTIGEAAFNGGPGISLLFVMTAVCCGFSALCYAEFASRIPVSGSAYTYSYASFGELIAWIIGWDLVMEYAIGNIAVAISWSGYFANLLEGFGVHLPPYFTTDYVSAYRGFGEATQALASGVPLSSLEPAMRNAYEAWNLAPALGPVRIIADLPALAIVVLITYLVYIGIRETKRATNLMVGLKLLVVIGVIAGGAFYITPANWHPFLPNGFSGMMKGVSAIFFAYIGFDAISTTAEECRNPQRDLPRGMIYSLLICTVLYICIALVLTGMVSYKALAVKDPLAFVFKERGLDSISYIISVSAVIATASVLLVFQMGQPRIWMSMSRDGLLPPAFSRIHPKFKTPSFATVVTGFIVAVPALFMNLTEVTDLCSIGTLFAFVLVCGGVLVLPAEEKTAATKKRFRIPYINGRYIVPVLLVAGMIVFWEPFTSLFHYGGDWHAYKDKLPFFLFVALAFVLSALTAWKKLSLIPVLGLASCFYLMTELGYTNWLRFLIWLVIGLVVYFTYSIRHSRLSGNGQ
ncbi:amino acid permease [Compostibacter hankyongensis]|uniref:Cationic amino acid transporter C-terminal domain-containing protein n=1 Tax=Compostibacter hankyongensis TaxID=1007089 RepID=A0ABP8FNK3_9BACT